MPGRAPRVLFIADDAGNQGVLIDALEARGYLVDCATSGNAGVSAIAREAPDLVLLDVNIADVEGLELCRRIRERSEVPVVILSSNSATSERIAALNQGADDVVVKPFNVQEVVARVQALFRRVFGPNTPRGCLRAGALTLDFDHHRAVIDAKGVRLTPKELALLAQLARRPNCVVSPQTLLTAIWGPGSVKHPEHLWVLVRQLRKKLEPDPAAPQYVVSDPGFGYRLAIEPA
jgi:two-component system KDP operon response regulator KdpE